MSNKLYVGNLSDDTDEEDLQYNFGELGTCISVNIIRDKATGRSKGFAFVEMATEQEAREVIRICRGVELDGNKLVVSEAKPDPRTNGRGESGKPRKRR